MLPQPVMGHWGTAGFEFKGTQWFIVLIVPQCGVIMAYGEYTAVCCIQFNGNMQVHTPKIALLCVHSSKNKTHEMK